MDKEKDNVALVIKILGIINVVVGGIYFVAYIFPFLAAVLVGWVTDNPINTSFEWFMLYIVGRLAVTIIFIGSFTLIKSGFLLFEDNKKGRKLGIISILLVVCGISIMFLSSIVDVLWFEKSALNINWYLIFLFVTILILSMEFIYLISPGVREKFADENIKIPLCNTIIISILIYISPVVLRFVSGILGR